MFCIENVSDRLPFRANFLVTKGLFRPTKFVFHLAAFLNLSSRSTLPGQRICTKLEGDVKLAVMTQAALRFAAEDRTISDPLRY